MKHRIIGLFGIFIPMTVIGSLVTVAPCHKAQTPVAPVQVARPDAEDAKPVDCAKVDMKQAEDVICQEPADAV